MKDAKVLYLCATLFAWLPLLVACDTTVPEPVVAGPPCFVEEGACHYGYTINNRIKEGDFIMSYYHTHLDQEFSLGKFSIYIYDTEEGSPPRHAYAIEFRLEDFPEAGEVIDMGQVDLEYIREGRGGKSYSAYRGLLVGEHDVHTAAAYFFPVPSERNELVITEYEFGEAGEVYAVSGTFEGTLVRTWRDRGSTYHILEDTLRIRDGSFRARVQYYPPLDQ